MNEPTFEEYFAIFAAKPMNEVDKRKACQQWISMDRDEHIAAMAHALGLSERWQNYIPFPINHLHARGWHRRNTLAQNQVQIERTGMMSPPLGEFRWDPELEQFIEEHERKRALL